MDSRAKCCDNGLLNHNPAARTPIHDHVHYENALLSDHLDPVARGLLDAKITEQQVLDTAATLDYGDFNSSTMTTRAWESLASENYAALLAYTRKVIELYGAQGRRMNAEMRAFEPSSTADQKWALNDVGTSLFIAGRAYEAMEMYPEAIEAYTTLTADYGYAQCWDPRGWYWRVADAANQRLEALGHHG